MGAFRKIRVRLYETQALKKTIVGHDLYSQQIDRGVAGVARQFARSRGNGGVQKDAGAFIGDSSF